MWLGVLWASWAWRGQFLTEDSSAPFTFIQLFLGEVKSYSDNPLSMAWKSIKGTVYKQLDEGAFYVEVAEWVASGPCELGKTDTVSFPKVGLAGHQASQSLAITNAAAPSFTLLLMPTPLLGPFWPQKTEGGAIWSLVGNQFLSKCQLGQLAPNRPSLLRKGLAKPKLACSILKTCLYLKTNSWQTVAPALRSGAPGAGTLPNTCN